MMELLKKWDTLEEEDQKSYMNRAAAMAANYKAEKIQWKENMKGTEKMEALTAAKETMRVLKRKMKQSCARVVRNILPLIIRPDVKCILAPM
jgi:uncharacterized protein (DUF2267 family)